MADDEATLTDARNQLLVVGRWCGVVTFSANAAAVGGVAVLPVRVYVCVCRGRIIDQADSIRESALRMYNYVLIFVFSNFAPVRETLKRKFLSLKVFMT